jgi:hypothetical protein
MLYDSLRYYNQCKILTNQHRKIKDLKNADELLSGLSKADRIKPVITLVLYYGEKDWDGPVKLSDMMDVPPQFKDFFDDRSIHLLCVRDAAKMDFKNKDNMDLFTSIDKIYDTKEKLKPDAFEEKDIYWETMAAIGAATRINVL